MSFNITVFFIIFLNMVLTISFIFYFLYRLSLKQRSRQLLEEIRAEMNLVLSELDRASERNISVIENRIIELNQAIKKSDGRIKLLSEKRVSHQINTPDYSHLERVKKIEGGIAEPNAKSKTNIKTKVLDKNPKNVSQSELDFNANQAQGERVVRLRNRDQVRHLYNRGESVKKIALKLEMSVGEVELILSLLKTSK